MKLLKKTPAAAFIRSDSEQADDVQQAGRTNSSIYAQRDANRASRSGISTPVSTSGVADSGAESHNLIDRNVGLPHPSLENGQSLTWDSGHAREITPPVNPFESEITSISGESSDVAGPIVRGREDATTDGSESSATSERPGSDREALGTVPIPSEPTSFSNTHRLEFPTSIGDFGQDYTRYPFYSRQHSNQDMTQSSRSLIDYSTPFSRSTASLPTVGGPLRKGETEKWGNPNDSIVTVNAYFGGDKGFILYPDEIEADDAYHLPADDDDIRYRPKWSDYFNQRAIVSTIGAAFICLGLLTIFIILPVCIFGGWWRPNQPGDQEVTPVVAQPKDWDWVNDNSYPLLKNVRQNLIDPDTPSSALERTSTSGKGNLKLVFSDEFKTPNRSFWPGDDPFWAAADLWYGSTQDLEWYDPDAVTTYDDALMLQLDAFENHNLAYRSGMVNSWNKLCFKGGIMEVSVSLPGPAGVLGLWPGVWTMGNLGRPGYRATTDGVWPYTYNNCDAGITPNQSATDGTSFLPGQKLSACTCPNEDHPNSGTGRGAPEIDVLEAGVDYTTFLPLVTQSYQVAPFDIFYSPNSDFMDIPNTEFTMSNPYRGGPYQQAVSASTLTNPEWFDGKSYQKYGFEYTPGDPANGAFITWFVGDDPSFTMDARAVRTNGNIGQRLVSEEPMSLTLNLGISDSWTFVNLAKLKFPTIMRIDYVRIYQPEGSESVTCDPPGHPTTEYIKNHPIAYENNNITSWAKTNYSWPTNTFMGGC